MLCKAVRFQSNPNMKMPTDSSLQELSIDTTLEVCIGLEIRFLSFTKVLSMFYIIHAAFNPFISNPGMDKKLCLKCGSGEHFASRCPQKE